MQVLSLFPKVLHAYSLSFRHYHFELGFRLELFVSYEFAYCYWYFGEIVGKSLINILERKCNLLILNYSRTAAMAADGSNKKKSAAAKKQLSKQQKAEAQLRTSISSLQKM